MTASGSKSVLVLGANGRFGATVVDAFSAAGWRVVAQARHHAATSRRPGIEAIDIDIRDTDRLAAPARGASAVVHAVNMPYPSWHAEALPAAHAGMDVAQRLDAVFLLPGNVYNFGAGMPPVLLPDTPQRPTTRLGEIRCAIEAEMQARSQAGLRSIVIRAGDFFGAGAGNWFDRVVVKSLGNGKLVYPGPLDRAHAWAYLPDLARSFVAAATCETRDRFTRLHFAGHTLDGAELLAAIARAARALGIAQDKPLRRTGLPWSALRLGGVVVPMWRELARMAYLWQVPHALDGAALRDTLGELAATNLNTAVAKSLLALGFGQASGNHAAANLQVSTGELS